MEYSDIGRALQIEGANTNVDVDFVKQQGVDVPENPSRNDGIVMFNAIAEKNNLKPLRDPMGYMKLDDNLYDTIHTVYQREYDKTIDMVDNGLMPGGSYGLVAVKNKLAQNIRHDMSPFMPENFKYSDLRFVKSTPDMVRSVEDYVGARVQLTHLHSIRRSVEASTFENIHQKMDMSGEGIKDKIEKVLIGEPTVPTKLSKTELLKNSKGNNAGLDLFIEQLTNPDNIDKVGDSRPVASFTTSDMPMARFLLSNKSYLDGFGFDITKGNRVITAKWSSDSIDKLYDEKQSNTVDLDLSDLDSGPEL